MEIRNRFLIVDDSLTIRRHLAYLLRLVGQGDESVTEAASAVEALREFRRIKPTVVFLDMMLPREADGTAAMTVMLRERPEATIVLVTALDQDHPAVRLAISQGAAAYLRKPLTVAALQQTLQELEAQSGRFRRVS